MYRIQQKLNHKMNDNTSRKNILTINILNQETIKCSAEGLFYTNCITTVIYGFLHVVNYSVNDALGNKIGGNALNMMTSHVLLGFLLSIITAVTLCIFSRLDSLSVKLCYLNAISIYIYIPFCLLSLFGFVEFGIILAPSGTGSVGALSLPLCFEFTGMVVASFLLCVLFVGNFILKLGNKCF